MGVSPDRALFGSGCFALCRCPILCPVHQSRHCRMVTKATQRTWNTAEASLQQLFTVGPLELMTERCSSQYKNGMTSFFLGGHVQLWILPEYDSSFYIKPMMWWSTISIKLVLSADQKSDNTLFTYLLKCVFCTTLTIMGTKKQRKIL